LQTHHCGGAVGDGGEQRGHTAVAAAALRRRRRQCSAAPAHQAAEALGDDIRRIRLLRRGGDGVTHVAGGVRQSGI
jgi:hypothetical protein